MLPLVEQDLLRMRAEGVRQVDVAKLLGWTQPNVGFRIKRAHARLKFRRELPVPSEAKLRRDLASVQTPRQIDVLWDLSLTSSQTNTARRLGGSQRRIRHALTKAHLTLQERKERHLRMYVKMTTMLLDRRNMNMLVVLPSCKGYQGRPVEYVGRLGAMQAANDG